MNQILVVIFFGVCIASSFTALVKREGDRSHWCCDVDAPTTYNNITEIQYIKRNVSMIKEIETGELRICHPGETPDASDGKPHILNTCHVKKTIQVTVEELVPKNVTVSIPQKGICPPEHTVCCEGFQKLNDQCVESGTANSPELQKLIDAGLVLG